MALLVLLVVAQSAGAPPQYDLQSYLRIATTYASVDHASAVQEILRWPSAVIRAAVADLKGRGRQLRVFSSSPGQIAIGTVEAAIVMHAEAGLLALKSADLEAAKSQLEASATLFSWSRTAAAAARGRGDAAGYDMSPSDGIGPRPASEYDVWPRISRGLLSLALAAGALDAGSPETARAFAEDARHAAPLDADVQLVFGCVAEGLAEDEGRRGREEAAARWRREATVALTQAITLDAGLFPDAPRADPTSRGLEARLHLGRIALEQRWFPQARLCFEDVDRKSHEGRQLYLARLLLGRLADREERPEEAIGDYRRALQARPDGQSAALALAHALERTAGAAAARPLVAKALAPAPRSGPSADPWRSYLFGPPGLADAILDHLRATALGP
jgi:tetratricopeptide (TPR) repeat protein